LVSKLETLNVFIYVNKHSVISSIKLRPSYNTDAFVILKFNAFHIEISQNKNSNAKSKS